VAVIELVELCCGKWRERSAGPEVLGMHIGSIFSDDDLVPLAPPALMAAIRLLVRPHLPNAFYPVPQARGENPW
jgi:hypothetical protein